MNRLQTVQTKWLKPIQLAQAATAAWIIVAQTLVCLVQHTRDLQPIVMSSLSILALLIPIATFSLIDMRPWQKFALLVFEISLITISSSTGVISGFQMLFLLTAMKAGVLLGTTSFVAICILATLCFTIFSQNNVRTLVQSSSTNDIASILLGREFVGFAVGMLLVFILATVVRREQANRKAAEQLSERLVSLATDLERNRISREINSNVDTLLQEVIYKVDFLETVLQKNDSTVPLALSQARELAANALAEVRRSLALLRDFETRTVENED